MARMITLNPAPKVQMAGGVWALLAPEAGRFADGLRVTTQLWNGALQHTQCLKPADIAAYVQATGRKYKIRRQALERAVLDLITAAEGVLRQATPSSASQQARPPSIVTRQTGWSG